MNTNEKLEKLFNDLIFNLHWYKISREEFERALDTAYCIAGGQALLDNEIRRGLTAKEYIIIKIIADIIETSTDVAENFTEKLAEYCEKGDYALGKEIKERILLRR